MVDFLFIPRPRDKTNHPDRSEQGCEKIDGGHGVSATFYQWSATLEVH